VNDGPKHKANARKLIDGLKARKKPRGQRSIQDLREMEPVTDDDINELLERF
jgi:hypothetical protein